MKAKKVPQRKCLGCNEQFDKKDLVRVVRDKEGHVILDTTGKAHGRGAYICNKSSCLETALKRKAIERALEVKLTEEVISSLKEAIKHEN
ncbi:MULTISPECIES: RNase P modulator RnpM [unclassified Fusibacter]|uniref:RNase P modulator RnpM n=1 Tax=unclassified Fusibacter TaxID=2624464 RepID=UPI001010E919|nr:YlxR family protein [Fusibacter sp. A1]MCK8058801.1 YlxR family protein [Fusibacter sp. A2]NPE21875.1 YlxR family protein [Fusibacter sp. A1]RXV61447.1 YlxR family protein [Fusibacter sp. A1]